MHIYGTERMKKSRIRPWYCMKNTKVWKSSKIKSCQRTVTNIEMNVPIIKANTTDTCIPVKKAKKRKKNRVECKGVVIPSQTVKEICKAIAVPSKRSCYRKKSKKKVYKFKVRKRRIPMYMASSQNSFPSSPAVPPAASNAITPDFGIHAANLVKPLSSPSELNMQEVLAPVIPHDHPSPSIVPSIASFVRTTRASRPPVYIQAPKILAKINVPVCINAEISFDHPVLEIKRASENVFLKECHLVAIHALDCIINEGKLFIDGFIETNMEYAAAELTDQGINGDIYHTSARIPFKCCTPIVFAEGNEPVLIAQGNSASLFIDSNHHGPEPHLNYFSNQVAYNHLPYCELVSYTIDELAQGKDYAKIDGCCDHEKVFRRLSKQIVLHLMIEVLQVQQVQLDSRQLC